MPYWILLCNVLEIKYLQTLCLRISERKRETSWYLKGSYTALSNLVAIRHVWRQKYPKKWLCLKGDSIYRHILPIFDYCGESQTSVATNVATRRMSLGCTGLHTLTFPFSNVEQRHFKVLSSMWYHFKLEIIKGWNKGQEKKETGKHEFEP